MGGSDIPVLDVIMSSSRSTETGHTETDTHNWSERLEGGPSMDTSTAVAAIEDFHSGRTVGVIVKDFERQHEQIAEKQT